MARTLMVVIALLAGVAARSEGQKIADEQGRREALELFRTGQRFLLAEQFNKAADAFSKAIVKDGLLTVAHYGLGQAYMNLRRFGDAAKAYGGCIEATRALHTLQQTNQFDVEKQRDAEIRALRTILNDLRGIREPTRLQLEQHLHDLENQRTSVGGVFRPPAEVLLALGSAHFKDGSRDAAETEWKAATELNPKLGEAHNNLAVVYMTTGRLDEAAREITLAEKTGYPVNPGLKDELKQKMGR